MPHEPPDGPETPLEDPSTDTIWLRFPLPGDADFEPAVGGLQLGELIGKGTMGSVFQARQRALMRTVAVKVPLQGSTDEARIALIQEARIAGALEHPNIVPVHDLAVIEGQPHVVMKQIEGKPWSMFLGNDPLVHATFGVEDAQSWHLRTLLTVCHALEYAHDRGVLHLDIKPSNVMIGQFGEVYLVDWGVATRIASDEGRRTVGTPAYMAPEMANSQLSSLTEASDVYQLGATLLHLLSGSPPTAGIMTLMQGVEPLTVSIDESLPLANLLKASLELDPAHRLGSVAAFRAQLQSHLSNRGTERLLTRALERLNLLEQRLDASQIDRLEAYELYRSCRFGFVEALADWPDAPGAEQGKTRALERMVRYEIDEEDDRAAELLLEQHPSPPESLLDGIARVREQKAAQKAQFERMKADQDPRTAWQARALVTGTLGVQWVVSPILFALVGFPPGSTREILVSAITFALSIALVVPLWGHLIRSRLNRAIVVGLILAPGLATTMHLGCWMGGVDTNIAATLELFVYFSVAFMVALLAEWRILPSALGLLVAFFVGILVPGTTQVGLVIAAGFVAFNAVAVWLPAGLRNEMPNDRGLLDR